MGMMEGRRVSTRRFGAAWDVGPVWDYWPDDGVDFSGQCKHTHSIYGWFGSDPVAETTCFSQASRPPILKVHLALRNVEREEFLERLHGPLHRKGLLLPC